MHRRLRSPGGALSGGQQQRLCIARSLAIAPDVLLMDEPCSALDPTSTNKIEETIAELSDQVTIVIVTHNMQQAHRVSDNCAFFLATHDTPGYIVESGPTQQIFENPADPRTVDYVQRPVRLDHRAAASGLTVLLIATRGTGAAGLASLGLAQAHVPCPRRCQRMTHITVTVDGVKYVDQVEPRLLLVHYLREVVGKTGTPVGCDTSNCGACTVLMDGQSVKSCSVLAVQADGSDVTTIEGLANGELHPVQRAFHEEHALQCGYCTPGMILAATDLLRDNPHPTEEEIRDGLEGNLCRCTGYENIVRAVKRAAEAGVTP